MSHTSVRCRTSRSPPHRLTDCSDDINVDRNAFRNHLPHLSEQAVALPRGKLNPGNHDPRNFAPLPIVLKRVEELEAVFFRHHQINEKDGGCRITTKPLYP